MNKWLDVIGRLAAPAIAAALGAFIAVAQVAVPGVTEVVDRVCVDRPALPPKP